MDPMTGVTLLDITIPKAIQPRLLNIDGTDHPLESAHDVGGPRALAYHNPNLPNHAARKSKSSRHTTDVYGTTTAFETLPPMFIFDSVGTK